MLRSNTTSRDKIRTTLHHKLEILPSTTTSKKSSCRHCILLPSPPPVFPGPTSTTTSVAVGSNANGGNKHFHPLANHNHVPSRTHTHPSPTVNIHIPNTQSNHQLEIQATTAATFYYPAPAPLRAYPVEAATASQQSTLRGLSGELSNQTNRYIFLPIRLVGSLRDPPTFTLLLIHSRSLCFLCYTKSPGPATNTLHSTHVSQHRDLALQPLFSDFSR